MAKAKKQTAYDVYEANIIKGADHFVACDFRGRGTYARQQRSSLKGAVEAAKTLIMGRDNPSGRGALVYAIKDGLQVVAATVKPQGAGDRYLVLPTNGARDMFDVVDEGTGGMHETLCSTSQDKAKRIADALNEAG